MKNNDMPIITNNLGTAEGLKTNEFNDATIDYNGEEPIIEEPNFEPKKSKLWIYLLIAGVIILLVVIFFAVKWFVANQKKLENLTLTAPDILYVGEPKEITGTATGQGNLEETTFNFKVSDSSIVSLKQTGNIKGKTVVNQLIPLEAGSFVLTMTGELKKVKLESTKKTIIVCKRLSEEMIGRFEMFIGETIETKVNLGENDECYSNFKTNILDLSVAKINDQGNLEGLKKGVTTITFTDGVTQVERTVTVKEKEIIQKVEAPNTGSFFGIFCLVTGLCAITIGVVILKQRNT